MRILVVEDDPILSDGLRAGLSLTGATVDVTETCEEADAAIATTRYSAIVLDIMLPDGSGLDVLRKLRSRHDATPVLLLTARDSVGDKVSGLDSGADDYLAKPFDLDETRRAAARHHAERRWTRDADIDARLNRAFARGSFSESRRQSRQPVETRVCDPARVDGTPRAGALARRTRGAPLRLAGGNRE